jgi:hypothetical protein
MAFELFTRELDLTRVARDALREALMRAEAGQV